jgi:nicotinamide phosphoribosyltransferase
MDADIYAELKDLYEKTGANMATLPFALHDFGARGVTCAEQAEIGGAAHLVSFIGSDTVEGVLAANFYYKNDMAAFSVAASEHAVECSFHLDDEGEIAYLDHMLTAFAKPGKIVSIVIDGKDVYRCANYLCTTFKDRIIASGAKVVFRPDSGDMMEVVPRLLKMQDDAFGHTMTSKGFKSINYVGVIQGDGVDHLAIRSLLGKIIWTLGYSADCVVFGSGGALLQKVNRDTYKFAQKASSVLLENSNGDLVWDSISKDPITDPGKKSKAGILTLGRHKKTGEYATIRIDESPLPNDYDDVMVLVYHNGDLYNEITLGEVRANVRK